ncbi:MAG: hypothetical protein SFY80_01790 [Verrucomicrobiota bacterium]|nr:hypothetical protein [Verrucomicrobiota bacterium]
MSDRYIPSLQRLAEASKELPAAGSWRDETYQVPVSASRSITFRRVKFKVSGGKDYNWIYDGKVRIRAGEESNSSGD